MLRSAASQPANVTNISTTMADISVIILTFNEELNIAQALDSVAGWANEIFILDSLKNRPERWRSHAGIAATLRRTSLKITRNSAITRSPSYLFIPSGCCSWMPMNGSPMRSNRKSQALIAGSPEENGFFIKFRLIWMGRWIRRGYYPSWISRLFRYGKGRCEDRAVNEHLIVQGTTGELRSDFMHEDRKGMTEWIAKHNGYATREARELFNTRTAKGLS